MGTQRPLLHSNWSTVQLTAVPLKEIVLEKQIIIFLLRTNHNEFHQKSLRNHHLHRKASPLKCKSLISGIGYNFQILHILNYDLFPPPRILIHLLHLRNRYRRHTWIDESI